MAAAAFFFDFLDLRLNNLLHIVFALIVLFCVVGNNGKSCLIKYTLRFPQLKTQHYVYFATVKTEILRSRNSETYYY